MMLTEVKNYVRGCRRVTMMDLATRFQVSPEVMRDMLQHWQRKGCISRCNKGPSCGKGCERCHPLMTELYEWQH